jgi:hypothetical protein
MATTNLVSIITQFLTPEVIARIASALGLDRSIAQKAITAAIPAILAYLGNAVTKPGGERQLANAMAQQPSGALDSLMSILGGSGQKSLAEQKSLVEKGSSLLSGLVGGSTQDTLTRAIGQYAGIGEGTSKSLIGMLGPVVLDTLGQQQRKEDLGIGGLADLLTSQRQQIAAALPSGVASQMSAVLDSLPGGAAASAAAARVGGASDAVIARAHQAASAARRAPSQWPYWVLGLAVLAGLAWLLANWWGGTRVAEQPRPTTAPTTVGLVSPNLTVGGIDLADQVNSSISALRSTLAGITDEASARAALPKLRDVSAQLERVDTLSAQFPPESRRALASLIATAMPTIRTALDRILAVPGAGDVARSTFNELRTRLDSLARA